jgi:hypothetical protein
MPVMLPLAEEVEDVVVPDPMYPATQLEELPVSAKLLNGGAVALTASVNVVIAVLLPPAEPWLNLK